MKTIELKTGDTVTINYGAMHGSTDYTVKHVRTFGGGPRGSATAELQSDDGETTSITSDSTETPTAIGWRLKSFSADRRRQTVTVSFEVIEDDMTSERAADYRAAIVDALDFYILERPNLDPDMTAEDEENRTLADKLLQDCNR